MKGKVEQITEELGLFAVAKQKDLASGFLT